MSTPTIFAVDPGLHGAWAAMSLRTGDFLGAGDLPRFERMLNGLEFMDILRKLHATQLVIEHVHSMPKQGVASSFTFGMSFGLIIGVSCGANLPLTLVTPQKWKNHFRLTGKAKEASRELVLRLYPDAREFLQRKSDHNRADAILIARYFIDLAKQGFFV